MAACLSGQATAATAVMSPSKQVPSPRSVSNSTEGQCVAPSRQLSGVLQTRYAHAGPLDAADQGSARVPPWEVAAQLGHSVGKVYAVPERYTAYSPEYLAGAVEVLDGLIGLTACGPVERRKCRIAAVAQR